MAHPTQGVIPMLSYEDGIAAIAWLERVFGFRERNGLLVYVDDVDAHLQRARQGGASILSGPDDGFPGKRYRAEDLEGQRWMFLQPLS